jgi:ABC-type polar amino acid transport system ATPase subunit
LQSTNHPAPGAQSMETTSILQVEQVSAWFGQTQVLKDVDLDAHKGEVVAIIGPSGSGKSTLLRCINGLVPFRSGTIRVVDQTIEGAPRAPRWKVRMQRERLFSGVRGHAGMVFQSYNLFPHMNILDNVTIGPRVVKGEPREEADERGRQLLQRVGLAGREGAHPHQLSGGQQQRVGIARALAMRPQLLLLDEITSALDPELVAEVLDVVAELAAAGQTMLLVTHELTFARNTADRIMVMDAGQVVECGPTKQVLDDPQTDRTQRFVSTLRSRGN